VALLKELPHQIQQAEDLPDYKMDPNNDLRESRRRLQTIENFELLEDFFWNAPLAKWVFKFRLIGNYTPTSNVPLATEWYCMVAPEYPWGGIDIYPSATEGIVKTFQHQSHNEPEENCEWRSGNICVSTSVGLWGKKFFNQEPYNAKERLVWHITRCVDWVQAAANDSLAVKGDPFEMPSFPKNKECLFAFNECDITYKQWQCTENKHGLVHSRSPFDKTAIHTIISFEAKGFQLNYEWGKHIRDSKSTLACNIWVLLKAIPVLDPWEMPTKWEELFDVVLRQGLDLRVLIGKYISKAKRDVKYLLLGFPISKNIGEATTSIYWQAIILPKLPSIKGGFRKVRPDMLAMQLKLMFTKEAKISWCETQNWNKLETSARGKLPDSITSTKFTIIGAGAIGANLTEMLVRLGCDNITIIDKDIVKIGNLSRHNLTMDQVWSSKAQSVADYLNSVFPSSNIKSIQRPLDSTMRHYTIEKIIANTDVFIEATGDDSLIHFISKLLFRRNKIFISLSTGFAAKRLFCFMKKTKEEPIAFKFVQKIQPWLDLDAKENPDPEFPRDGIGCWHPVFPARIDDIMMLLSLAIQQIEHFLDSDKEEDFLVIEKDISNINKLNGIKITEG